MRKKKSPSNKESSLVDSSLDEEDEETVSQKEYITIKEDETQMKDNEESGEDAARKDEENCKRGKKPTAATN